MTKKYTLVTNYDDWEGLYINGVLFAEGHKLDNNSDKCLL